MDAVTELAKVLSVPAVRLYSPYPFHSPVLEPITADFAARLRGLEQKPLERPRVLADPRPLLRRIGPADRSTRRAPAHPVRFADAIRTVHGEGDPRFVGVRRARHVERDRQARSSAVHEFTSFPASCLARRADRRSRSAIETLTGKTSARVKIAPRPVQLLPAGTDAATIGAFFAERGDRVQSFVQSGVRSVPLRARRAGRGSCAETPSPAAGTAPAPAGVAAEPAAAGNGGVGVLAGTSCSPSSSRSTPPLSSIPRRSSRRTLRSKPSSASIGEAGGADRPRCREIQHAASS